MIADLFAAGQVDEVEDGLPDHVRAGVLTCGGCCDRFHMETEKGVAARGLVVHACLRIVTVVLTQL